MSPMFIPIGKQFQIVYQYDLSNIGQTVYNFTQGSDKMQQKARSVNQTVVDARRERIT